MRPRLIISGVRYPGGGLSNVFHYLVSYLKDSFEIVCLGFTPNQNSNVEEGEIEGCKLYSFDLKGLHFEADHHVLNDLVQSFDPDQFLLLGPLAMNAHFLDQLQAFRREGKRISAYASIEGRIVNETYFKYLSKLDLCIFYTQAAQDSVVKLLESTAYEGPIPQFGIIGHGLDKSQFYPIAENTKECRKTAREIIYPNHDIQEDSFVVLNINRPYYRKRIDLTIDGFEHFSRDKQNVFLHLHLGSVTKEEIQRIMDLVKEKGIESKVIITPDLETPAIKTESWLNYLYNACDVGLSTSMGEGWGLGLFEHAATKAAIVAPNHTSFNENWSEAALLMECSDTQYVFYELADMDIIAPGEVKKSLDQLFYDRALLNSVAEKCFNKLSASKNDWRLVVQSFEPMLSFSEK